MARDQGYSSPTIRRFLEERRIEAVIPTKANQEPGVSFDREVYRDRTVVERRINRLKQYRGIATRDEKRAANFPAMLTLAAILL